jgi:hypothetical protein
MTAIFRLLSVGDKCISARVVLAFADELHILKWDSFSLAPTSKPRMSGLTLRCARRFRVALISAGANLLAHLQVHDELTKQTNPFLQKVRIPVQPMLAQILEQCHTDIGHRVLLVFVICQIFKETHDDAFCQRSEFTPRSKTLSGPLQALSGVQGIE